MFFFSRKLSASAVSQFLTSMFKGEPHIIKHELEVLQTGENRTMIINHFIKKAGTLKSSTAPLQNTPSSHNFFYGFLWVNYRTWSIQLSNKADTLVSLLQMVPQKVIRLKVPGKANDREFSPELHRWHYKVGWPHAFPYWLVLGLENIQMKP